MKTNDCVRIKETNSPLDGRRGRIHGRSTNGMVHIWIVELYKSYIDTNKEEWRAVTIPGSCLEEIDEDEYYYGNDIGQEVDLDAFKDPDLYDDIYDMAKTITHPRQMRLGKAYQGKVSTVTKGTITIKFKVRQSIDCSNNGYYIIICSRLNHFERGNPFSILYRGNKFDVIRQIRELEG